MTTVYDSAPVGPELNWTGRALIAIAILTVAVAAWLIVPDRVATSIAAGQIDAAAQQEADLLAAISEADQPGAADLVAALDSQTTRLEALLPAASAGLGVDPLELELTNTLLASGWQVTSQERGAAVTVDDTLGYVPVTIQVIGPADQTTGLLDSVTAVDRIVTVANPEVRIAADGDATIDTELRLWHRP